jgi:hypothetical protein
MDQKATQIFNMNLNNIFNDVISEQDNSMPKTTRNKQLSDAITKRHPITFYYSGPRKPKKRSVKAGYRVKAEAVALGLNKKGNLVIRAWIDNPSKSKRGTPSDVGNEKANYGWRTFLVTRMSSIQVLTKETFDVPREKFNGGGDDNSMNVTYVSTNFSSKLKEPEIKQEPKPEPEKPTVKVTPTKPAKKPGITKITRNFDKEITTAQNDLAKVVSDMESTNEKYKKVKDTPEAEPLLNTLKDLTAKKKDLIKKIDDLINQFAISGVDADKVNVQKFQSANRAIKNKPEINIPEPSKKPTKKPNEPNQSIEKTKLPEPKKTEKPDKKPEDDNRYDLNESFVYRVKKLISYF